MERSVKFKLIWRWSLITATAIALFWIFWHSFVGSIPVAVNKSWIHQTAISRWWDVLIGPLWSIILILIFTNEKLKNKDRLILAVLFGSAIGLISGLIFGLIFSVSVQTQFIGLIFILIIMSVAFLLLFFIYGLNEALVFSLFILLGYGLIFGLFAEINLLISFGILIALPSLFLRYLLFKISNLCLYAKNWLLAK